MSSSHFNKNKPIHLARRDAYFQRAVERLHMPTQHLETNDRITHVNQVIHLLEQARRHAFFASRAGSATDYDRDFLRFLELILHNAESIKSMMKHQAHLEEEESFLCQFLHTRPELCALPAHHYRRRADDLVEGVGHLLRLAHTPFQKMLQETQHGMTDEDQARYQTAYGIYAEELRAIELPEASLASNESPAPDSQPEIGSREGGRRSPSGD